MHITVVYFKSYLNPDIQTHITVCSTWTNELVSNIMPLTCHSQPVVFVSLYTYVHSH